jgi:hypothetical protein
MAFQLPLVYAIKWVQVTHDGFHLIGTYQLLDYTDDVYKFEGSTGAIKNYKVFANC